MNKYEHLKPLDAGENSECVALFQRLCASPNQFPNSWIILRTEAVEQNDWTVALMDGMWAGQYRPYYLEWMRRALPQHVDKLWGVLWDDLEHGYAVDLTYASMAQLLSEADVMGGTLIDPDSNLCVVRFISNWEVVAGPREIVEAVVHTNLETRWEQFTYFAEWGDPYESVNRRRKELMRYYVRYNGLESNEVPEEIHLPDYEQVAVSLQPSEAERERASEMLSHEGFLETRRLLDREWAVAAIWGNYLEERENGIAYSLPTAEWLTKATSKFGMIRAVDPDEGERGYEIPCTRDGWLAFEALTDSGTLVVYPEHSQYVVLGLQLKFTLVAGEPEFVAEALGDSTIRGNRMDLGSWVERVQESADSAQRYVRKNLARCERLLEWYDETWEAIEAAGYFEDPWPIPWE